MKESISYYQSLLAPYTAPLPSAAVVGISLYHSLLGADMPPLLAGVVAFIGMVGMESAGALSSNMAARAFAKKEWGAMALALVGVTVYAAVVIWAIYTSKDPRAIVASVLITLIAYLGMALFEYLKEGERAAQRELTTLQVQSNSEINVLNARRKLVNSETRKAKVSSVSSGNDSLSSGQDGQVLNPETLAKVCEHLANNPNATLRDLVKVPGIGFSSPETARKYKRAAEEMLK